MLKRPLVPVAALLWGLQFAFLSPALALILTGLYGATPAEVGIVLAIYNTGGFVAALLIPAWADRRRDYLRPMLGAAVLTLALAVALGATTSLPVATVALVVLGGPAGVGNSLLFAHLRQDGASAADVVNTRAVFSFAWVAGPPVATALIGWFGNPSVLVAIAGVAVLNVATTLLMLRARRRPTDPDAVAPKPGEPEVPPTSRARVAVVLVGFVLAQATNAAGTVVITLFVTEDLGLPVVWAGIALGLCAGLEIPALLALGRLSGRFPLRGILAVGLAAGAAYYAGMVLVREPVLLLALQVLNAVFFASVAGIGLTLFQQLLAGPGIATGLYTNTRRVGSIVAGPLVGIAAGPWGYAGVYGACAVLTVLAGLAVWAATPARNT